jgi:hypothetical protein
MNMKMEDYDIDNKILTGEDSEEQEEQGFSEQESAGGESMYIYKD